MPLIFSLEPKTQRNPNHIQSIILILNIKLFFKSGHLQAISLFLLFHFFINDVFRFKTILSLDFSFHLIFEFFYQDFQDQLLSILLIYHNKRSKMNGPVQPTNIFAMFQRNTNCYYPCVRIDFTEVKDLSESTSKGENVFKKIIPSYNNDGLYFTDAFVLESQVARKTINNKNISEIKEDDESKGKFQSRIQKVSDNMEIQEIHQAQPESFFCQICRSPFENYHDHILRKDHIRNLEFSKGHKFIKQICKQAKKYCSENQNDQQIQQVQGLKKSKPIRSKRVVSKKVKSLNLTEFKITSNDHTIQNVETKCCEHDQTLESRTEKCDKFGSIINSQMKQSAVEKLKIQNIK